ncbi:MAG: heavy-metal-associated domain-containing protein [Aeromicrobium sp.]|uniref:heavy-metal-associated domain-containing protein n=1 Tax=Aeromicrobium sp. TaxID=1871063 RepID=UPI0039E27A4C
MSTTTYHVDGMTCGHCTAALTEELSALDGVSAVEIDLVQGGTSTVRVSAERELTRDEVAAAVEEAGYALARPGSLPLA